MVASGGDHLPLDLGAALVTAHKQPWLEPDNLLADLDSLASDLHIPAGSYELQITCVFEEDYDMLYLLGHMHEWGTSFRIDHNKLDGSTDTLYELPVWDVQYRDNPPITRWDEGFPIAAGESFTTTCVWDNDTSAELTFPFEMCVTTGMVYPSTVPVLCEPD